VVFVEAKSDTERGRFDWSCYGGSAAQLWMFHKVLITTTTAITTAITATITAAAAATH